jgi:hypothetical protein
MSENISIYLIAVTYKVFSLCAGLLFGYMGYRLFMAGIWGNAGDVETKFKDTKLVLKQAAPGTFFALFGTIIVAFTIFTGISLDKGTDRETFAPATQLPDKPPF